MTYSSIKNIQNLFFEHDEKLLINFIIELKYNKYQLNSQKINLIRNKIKTTLVQLKQIKISQDAKYFLLPLDSFSVLEKKLEICKKIKCRIYPIKCIEIDSCSKINFTRTKSNILSFQKSRNSENNLNLWLYSWEDIMSSKLLIKDNISELDYVDILANLFWDLTYLGFDKKIVDSRRHRQIFLDKIQRKNPTVVEMLVDKQRYLEKSIEKTSKDCLVRNWDCQNISSFTQIANLKLKSENMNALVFDKFFDMEECLHV